MPDGFLSALRSSHDLTEAEEIVLEEAGIRTPEELYVLTRSFPGLHQAGLNLPGLSSAAVQLSGGRLGASASVRLPPAKPVRAATGARHPGNAPWAPGDVVPMPPRAGTRAGAWAPGTNAISGGTSATAGGSASPAAGAIDLRLPSWPVRDQGDRGACVAFALAACREHLAHHTYGASLELSEQFLYWAAKGRDGFPSDEGTFLVSAGDALALMGICEGRLWPYVPTAIAGNVSHGTNTTPSKPARQDARTRRHRPKDYYGAGAPAKPSGTVARAVWDKLATGRPVAVTLPVFEDASGLSPYDNWNWPYAQLYGRILDPLPTFVATGLGHAVCITGFVPDSAEGNGGYFVFRNSWGTGWAHAAPLSPYNAPEPGYGEISATHVDRFLWEMCSL